MIMGMGITVTIEGSVSNKKTIKGDAANYLLRLLVVQVPLATTFALLRASTYLFLAVNTVL